MIRRTLLIIGGLLVCLNTLWKSFMHYGHMGARLPIQRSIVQRPCLPFSCIMGCPFRPCGARYMKAWRSEILGKSLTKEKAKGGRPNDTQRSNPAGLSFVSSPPGREVCFLVQALEPASKAWPKVNLAS